MTVGEDGQIIFNSNPGTTFESVLPLVYEDTLYEFVKYLHIKLNSINLQIPWIYLLRNRDLLSKDNLWMDPDFDANFE